MSWLIETFSERSDQARLVTIVISALVAVFVVLLNQWFISRRSKRELLIEKIEELFSTSNEYVALCRELMDSLQNHNHVRSDDYYSCPTESVNKLNDSVTKMQMICGLYFKEEKFDPNDYYIWRMPILEIAHKGKSLPEGEAHTAYEDSWAHIRKSREMLDALCMKLMKTHGH